MFFAGFGIMDGFPDLRSRLICRLRQGRARYIDYPPYFFHKSARSKHHRPENIWGRQSEVAKTVFRAARGHVAVIGVAFYALCLALENVRPDARHPESGFHSEGPVKITRENHSAV